MKVMTSFNQPIKLKVEVASLIGITFLSRGYISSTGFTMHLHFTQAVR